MLSSSSRAPTRIPLAALPRRKPPIVAETPHRGGSPVHEGAFAHDLRHGRDVAQVMHLELARFNSLLARMTLAV
jgi:hypothetical protein